MSEFTTSNGITIKINEDGSITQVGTFKLSMQLDDSNLHLSIPEIQKFIASPNTMKCGDQVMLYWSILNSTQNILQVKQGNTTKTYNVPSTGELTLKSDLISDDIVLMLESSNSKGTSYARERINVSLKSINYESSKFATIVSIIGTAAVILGLICYFI